MGASGVGGIIAPEAAADADTRRGLCEGAVVISLPLRIALATLATVLLMAGAWKSYVEGMKTGRAAVQRFWDAEKFAAAESRRLADDAQQRVVARVMTKHVAKAAKDRIVYRDLVREVDRYVPSDLAVLPGSFRVLHDAAATGNALPDATDSGGADAATVGAQDLAETLIVNYEECRIDQDRLRALQAVVKSFTGE